MSQKRDRLEQAKPTLRGLTDAMIGQPEVVEREVVVYQADPNAIQRHDDGTMTYKRFRMTAVGLVVPEDVEEPEWEDVGHVIRDLESSISWIIGDWAAYANRNWNMTAAQIAERFGYEQSTVETYISICTAVPGLIRNQTATFSHHRLIAKLGSQALQTAWLHYMGALRLKVTEAKFDMALLVSCTEDEAIRWLYHALEHQARLIEFDYFKQKNPRLPKTKRGDPYELRNNWLDYIRTEEPKRPNMTPDQLDRLADRYEWLGKHFLEEAQSIKRK